ncbi:unnamed protein product [Ilex paraguariensis]|uniref:Uncharacterized protein n=1 Tax=Ilex paraguariensis TaxID=185542 RepID=A0ABC8R4R7_9AQUA
MLEEHDSVVGSPTHSRVRLFLFPVKSESLRSVLLDLKAESWFSDALKSTRINQKGRNDDSGLDCLGFSDSSGECQVESGEGRSGLELGSSSMPESMVLETSSSFGSTTSSASMSNLPPIGAHGEDGVVNLQDTKVKVASPGPIESECLVQVLMIGKYSDVEWLMSLMHAGLICLQGIKYRGQRGALLDAQQETSTMSQSQGPLTKEDCTHIFNRHIRPPRKYK